MYYRVDIIKFKKYDKLSLKVSGLEDVDLSLFSPKAITVQDISGLSVYKTPNEALREIDLKSKVVYANGHQSRIINLSQLGENLIFSSIEDFAEYIALIDLKVKNIYIKTLEPITEKFFIETNYSAISNILRFSNSIDWSIPKFEVVNDWDSKEFNLSFLNSKSTVDYQEFFRFAPKNILLDSEVLSVYLKSDIALSSLPRVVKNSTQFNSIVINNFDLFSKCLKSHIKFDIRESLMFASKHSGEYIDIDNFNTKHLSNIPLEKIHDNQNLLDSVNNAIWYKDNFFDKKDKLIEFIEWHYENVKAKSLSQLMEVISLFNRDFLRDENVQNLIRKSYRTYSFDYGSTYLKSYIPNDYFDSPEVCKKFIKAELESGLTQVSFLFPKHISTNIKSDIDFIEELICLVKSDNKLYPDQKKLCSNIVLAFREYATYDVKRSPRFLKLLLDHVKVDLNSWSYGGSFASYYENYLMHDKDLRSHIENNVNPENLTSLPLPFIYSLENRELIKSIVKIKPEILTNKKAPKHWLYDINLLAAIGHYSHEVNLNKSDFKSIISSKEVALKLLSTNAFIYTKFPKNYQKDEEISLLAITSKPTLAAFCEPSLLLNREFCLKLLLSGNSNMIGIVPVNLLYDSLFMTMVFENIDSGKVNNTIINHFPKEISQCLNAFKVQRGGYKNFAESFFNKQSLKSNLGKTEQNQVKKLKI